MKHLMICATALFFAACGGSETTDTNATSNAVNESLESFERIKNMEDSIYNAKVFEPRGVRALYDVYNAHLAKFPNDTITPHVLFRAANTGRNLNFDEKAVMQFDRILKDHSDWFKVSDAAYLKAFTLDEMPGKEEAAKAAYEEVIKNYPNNKFADDAKKMLENVYLSDEELIKKFEEMNKEAAAK